MSDTATITRAPEEKQSSLFGISVRAVIAMSLCLTVCASHMLVGLAVCIDAIRNGNFDKVGTLTTIGEPLYSMGLMALGFFFAQKPQTQPTKTT